MDAQFDEISTTDQVQSVRCLFYQTRSTVFQNQGILHLLSMDYDCGLLFCTLLRESDKTVEKEHKGLKGRLQRIRYLIIDQKECQ